MALRSSHTGDGTVIYDPQFSYEKRCTHRRQAVRESVFHRFGLRRERKPGFSRFTRRLEDLLENLRRHVSNAAHHPYATIAGTCGVLLLLAAVVMPVSAKVLNGRSVAALEIPLAIPALSPQDLASLPSEPAVGPHAAVGALGGLGEGWEVFTVARNETLGDIFGRAGLDAKTTHAVVNLSPRTRDLVKIFPGEQIAVKVEGGELQALQFDADESSRVLLDRQDGKLNEHILERKLEYRVQYAAASITSSLFGAGQDAGLSDPTTMKLAEVFNYDIDFAQDLREGDTFSVIYEEVWRDGERLRTGDILAASFTNRGKRFEVYRFVDSYGRADYYGADGRSRARAFIRTPLEFSRITSRFSLGRKHPILGTMRAHKGVDYGAPTGTPIKATGNGTVEFIGVQNGYGNVVILRHGKEFTTLYGHMSRFAKGLHRGSKVSQSEVIGYVGMTGLATGPHLHYEFRKGGAHRDPLSVDLPVADPLSGTEIAKFRAQTTPLIAQIKTMETTLLAAGPQFDVQ